MWGRRLPHSARSSISPLVQDVDAGWHAPHSHLYSVTRQQVEDVGICVLADGVEAGVYVAVSQNPLEFLFCRAIPNTTPIAC